MYFITKIGADLCDSNTGSVGSLLSTLSWYLNFNVTLIYIFYMKYKVDNQVRSLRQLFGKDVNNFILWNAKINMSKIK